MNRFYIYHGELLPVFLDGVTIIMSFENVINRSPNGFVLICDQLTCNNLFCIWIFLNCVNFLHFPVPFALISLMMISLGINFVCCYFL